MPTTSNAIELPYHFIPWPHQRVWFRAFDRGIRRFCEIVHRRGGKDKAALNLMIREMMSRVGNYCHVFPQRNRARLIIWEGIDTDGRRYIDHFPPPLIHRVLEHEMMISLKHPTLPGVEGSIYRCMGSDRDVHLLVGANPVGVIWSEYPEINPRMRELVLPILRRNHGWEILVYTPRGRNHAYRLYQQVKDDPEWHTSFLPITATVDHEGLPLVTDADVQADLRAGMLQETAEQEYYLSWDTPMPGAYYGEEFRRIDAEGRIRSVPYDATLPVYTAWDLGINDVNAVWYFQPAGHEVRFIDYDEAASVALVPAAPGDAPHDNWVGRLRQKPYGYDHSKLPLPLSNTAYEVHYAPHDLMVREYSSGKSRYEHALRAGLRFTVLPAPGAGGLLDGIESSRLLLGRAVFDAEHCAKGLEALRSYRRDWDEKALAFANRPLHDWSSNGADAFRYAAVGLGPGKRPAVSQPPPRSFKALQKLAHGKGKPGRSFKVYG